MAFLARDTQVVTCFLLHITSLNLCLRALVEALALPVDLRNHRTPVRRQMSPKNFAWTA